MFLEHLLLSKKEDLNLHENYDAGHERNSRDNRDTMWSQLLDGAHF